VFVFDSLENLSADHYKNVYKNFHEMYITGRKNKLIMIFLNNLKMAKKDDEFYLSPENTTLNEFMNNIVLFQKDYTSGVIASVIKSNLYYPEYKLNVLNKTLIISEK
jgi:hypothetical protein